VSSLLQDLFQKTVGPLKDSFLIYNSEGRSKGMAVVIFQRPGDAAVARTKYNGKIVDGRKYIPPATRENSVMAFTQVVL
jgi:THO complex subunit 4